MGEKNYLSSFLTSASSTLLNPFIITRESAHFMAAANGHLLYMVFPVREALCAHIRCVYFCVQFVAFLPKLVRVVAVGYC